MVRGPISFLESSSSSGTGSGIETGRGRNWGAGRVVEAGWYCRDGAGNVEIG